MLASILCGMATAGVWHPCLTTVVTSLIPKKADTNFLTDPGGLRHGDHVGINENFGTMNENQ